MRRRTFAARLAVRLLREVALRLFLPRGADKRLEADGPVILRLGRALLILRKRAIGPLPNVSFSNTGPGPSIRRSWDRSALVTAADVAAFDPERVRNCDKVSSARHAIDAGVPATVRVEVQPCEGGLIA